MLEKADNDGKIFLGVDATGKAIWTTEEEQEHDARNLQKWQRAKFAKELGFNPDTTDKAELAMIDKKYEEMIKEVNEWNEEGAENNRY